MPPIPMQRTSSDPLFGTDLYATSSTDENIVCDRCRFKGNGAPDNGVRNLNVIAWDGMNVAFTNSYFDGMHYFHGTIDGTSALSGTGPQSFSTSRGHGAFRSGFGNPGEHRCSGF